MTNALEFSETLRVLRTTASVFYDQGRAQGLPPEEIATQILPISERLEAATSEAVQENTDQVILAVKLLEQEAHMHEASARYLEQKADEARAHSLKLKTRLGEWLRARGVPGYMKNGLSVTVVTADNGSDVVTVR